MQCYQIFAGNQNQAYRSVIWKHLPKEQTWDWSKQCAAINVFFGLSLNFA